MYSHPVLQTHSMLTIRGLCPLEFSKDSTLPALFTRNVMHPVLHVYSLSTHSLQIITMSMVLSYNIHMCISLTQHELVSIVRRTLCGWRMDIIFSHIWCYTLSVHCPLSFPYFISSQSSIECPVSFLVCWFSFAQHLHHEDIAANFLYVSVTDQPRIFASSRYCGQLFICLWPRIFAS